MTRSAGYSLLSLRVPNCSLNNVFARLLGSVLSRFRQFALYLRASCLTVDICRSCWIIVLGTYHGASVIMRSTFDWNRSSISRFEFDAVPHSWIP